VGLHLFSIPSNRDRFRAAIMESNPLSLPYPSLMSQVEAKWQEFLGALCFETNICNPDLAALRALPLSVVETVDGDYTSLTDVIGRLQVPTAIANVLPWTPIVDGQIFSGETLIQNQPYQGFTSGPNGTAEPKPYLIGVNRDEGALFADLVNQGVGGIGESAYQELLETAFGATDGAAIAGFAGGGQHADQRLRLPLRHVPHQRRRRRGIGRQAGLCLRVRAGPHLQQRRFNRLRAVTRRSGHPERLPRLRGAVRLQHAIYHRRRADPAGQPTAGRADRAPLDQLCPEP